MSRFGLSQLIPARSKLKTLSGHSDELFSSAFSPDGRFVVTGSGYLRASGAPLDDGNEIRVWDARTGREVLRYRSASMPVQHVSFGGDASTILAASMDGRIRHYRCEPCAPLAVLTQLAAKRSARASLWRSEDAIFRTAHYLDGCRAFRRLNSEAH